MNTSDTEFDSDQREFQEEWLSAYLDNELTEPQRQIVEQRLSSDPAAQLLLADLRKIRNLVAELPEWTGGKIQVDVDASMLEEADEENFDRIMESDDQEASTLVAPSKLVAPEKTRRRSHFGGLKLLAAAASLLAMLGVGLFLFRKDIPLQTLATHLGVNEQATAPQGTSSADGDLDQQLKPAPKEFDFSSEGLAAGRLQMEPSAAPASESAASEEPAALPKAGSGRDRAMSLSPSAVPPLDAVADGRVPEQTSSLRGVVPMDAGNSYQSGGAAFGDIDAMELESPLAETPALDANALLQQIASNTSVRIGRSQTWSEQDFAKGLLQAAPMLGVRSLFRRAAEAESRNQENGRSGARAQRSSERFYKQVAPRQLAAPIPVVVARLEETRSVDEVFAELLSSNDDLQSVTVAPKFALGAGGYGGSAEAAAVVEPAPDTTLNRTADDAGEEKPREEAEDKARAIQALESLAEPASQMGPDALARQEEAEDTRDSLRADSAQPDVIALFVVRQEAEQILSQVSTRSPPSNQMWILPIDDPSPQPQPTDRVILLLNSRPN